MTDGQTPQLSPSMDQFIKLLDGQNLESLLGYFVFSHDKIYSTVPWKNDDTSTVILISEIKDFVVHGSLHTEFYAFSLTFPVTALLEHFEPFNEEDLEAIVDSTSESEFH